MRLSQTIEPRNRGWIVFAVAVLALLSTVAYCAWDVFTEAETAECRAKLCRSPFTDPVLMWGRCFCVEEAK